MTHTAATTLVAAAVKDATATALIHKHGRANHHHRGCDHKTKTDGLSFHDLNHNGKIMTNTRSLHIGIVIII